MGSEVDVVVTYLAGKHYRVEVSKHVYRYTSGAAYMKDREPANGGGVPPKRRPRRRGHESNRAQRDGERRF
jgi:hypothetical protein